MRIVTRTYVAGPGFEPFGPDGKLNPALREPVRQLRRDVKRMARQVRRRRLGPAPRPRPPRLVGATVRIERPVGLPIEAEACAGLDPPTPPLHVGVILPGVLAEIQRRMRRRRSA